MSKAVIERIYIAALIVLVLCLLWFLGRLVFGAPARESFSWSMPHSVYYLRVYRVDEMRGGKLRAETLSIRPAKDYCQLTGGEGVEWFCTYQGDPNGVYKIFLYDMNKDRLVWPEWQVIRCDKRHAWDPTRGPAWACGYEHE